MNRGTQLFCRSPPCSPLDLSRASAFPACHFSPALCPPLATPPPPVYGTHLDDVDIIMTRRDIFRHMFNGGFTPNYHMGFSDYVGESCALALCWLVERVDPHKSDLINLFLLMWRPISHAALALILLCAALCYCVKPLRGKVAGGLFGLLTAAYCFVVVVNLSIPRPVFFANAADSSLLRPRTQTPILLYLVIQLVLLALGGTCVVGTCHLCGCAPARSSRSSRKPATAEFARVAAFDGEVLPSR